jgi:hypothetical protein
MTVPEVKEFYRNTLMSLNYVKDCVTKKPYTLQSFHLEGDLIVGVFISDTLEILIVRETIEKVVGIAQNSS